MSREATSSSTSTPSSRTRRRWRRSSPTAWSVNPSASRSLPDQTAPTVSISTYSESIAPPVAGEIRLPWSPPRRFSSISTSLSRRARSTVGLARQPGTSGDAYPPPISSAIEPMASEKRQVRVDRQQVGDGDRTLGEELEERLVEGGVEGDGPQRHRHRGTLDERLIEPDDREVAQPALLVDDRRGGQAPAEQVAAQRALHREVAHRLADGDVGDLPQQLHEPCGPRRVRRSVASSEPR